MPALPSFSAHKMVKPEFVAVAPGLDAAAATTPSRAGHNGLAAFRVAHTEGKERAGAPLTASSVAIALLPCNERDERRGGIHYGDKKRERPGPVSP